MSEFWWSVAEKDHAARLWREGRSAAQIAAAIGGVSRSAVLGIMNRDRDRFPKRGKAGPKATHAAVFFSTAVPVILSPA